MALWSFLITLYITYFKPELVLAVFTKLFLVIILWMALKDKNIRKRLKFYRICGVSDFKFFSTIFLFDSALTCVFLSLIKYYI